MSIKNQLSQIMINKNSNVVQIMPGDNEKVIVLKQDQLNPNNIIIFQGLPRVENITPHIIISVTQLKTLGIKIEGILAALEKEVK